MDISIYKSSNEYYTYYNITSKNKNFDIQLHYDEKGLHAFSLTEMLSGIEIIFNYAYYGETDTKMLRSYLYEDNNYHVMANLLELNDPYLIEKNETYKGIGKKYYLYNDARVEMVDFVVESP
jgi:hypothetical protein